MLATNLHYYSTHKQTTSFCGKPGYNANILYLVKDVV